MVTKPCAFSLCWLRHNHAPREQELSQFISAPTAFSQVWSRCQSVSRSATFTPKIEDPRFSSPLSRHLAWTSHHPPSPTPIPQLDGDTPEPHDPRPDRTCRSGTSLDFILSLELELNLSLKLTLSLSMTTTMMISTTT